MLTYASKMTGAYMSVCECRDVCVRACLYLTVYVCVYECSGECVSTICNIMVFLSLRGEPHIVGVIELVGVVLMVVKVVM